MELPTGCENNVGRIFARRAWVPLMKGKTELMMHEITVSCIKTTVPFRFGLTKVHQRKNEGTRFRKRNRPCTRICNSKIVGSRQSGTGTSDRETDRERDRQRQTQTQTDRDRQRQTETDRDRQRETERDRERQRETERDRERAVTLKSSSLHCGVAARNPMVSHRRSAKERRAQRSRAEARFIGRILRGCFDSS